MTRSRLATEHAGITVDTEELCRAGTDLENTQDRYDLTLRGAAMNGTDVVVDITVCHPQAQAYRKKAAAIPLSTAKDREKLKKDHYQPLVSERRVEAKCML